MLRKTLLKNTREFLEKNFPENFFLLKNCNKKQKKLLFSKSVILKKKLLRFKQKKFNLFNESSYKAFSNSGLSYKTKNRVPNNFLFPMSMIKSEFEKKQTRSSDFKVRLKEKKKLCILYGNLSNKEIKKALQKAQKLPGNAADNLLLILESRLDVILYRALFFPSIRSAKQWIRCNQIYVNSKCITIPSYQTNFADIISVNKKNKKLIANTILKFFLHSNFYKEKNVAEQNNQLITRCKKMNFVTESQSKNLSFIYFVSKQMKNLKNKLNSPHFNKLIQNSSLFFSNIFMHKQQHFMYNYIKLNFLKKKIIVFLHNKNEIVKNYNIKMVNKYTYFNAIPWNFKLQNFKNTTENSSKQVNTVIQNTNFMKLSFNKLEFKTNKENIKNTFREKHRYIISNSFFNQLQSEITPTNKFLVLICINKLVYFLYNKFLFPLNFKKNAANLIKPQNLFLCRKFECSANLFSTQQQNKLIIKAEILLNNINEKIINQTKEIIQLALYEKNNSFIYQDKKFYIDNIIKLNSIKYYDILMFLKLKTFFFKKRAVSARQDYLKKINFKPLNLEISYKTLTIIYLYPCQKILFPCTLDIELLLKGNI